MLKVVIFNGSDSLDDCWSNKKFLIYVNCKDRQLQGNQVSILQHKH